MAKAILKYVKLNRPDTVRNGSSTGFLPSTLNNRQITRNVEHIRFLIGVIEWFFPETKSTTKATMLRSIRTNLLTFEGTARKIA